VTAAVVAIGGPVAPRAVFGGAAKVVAAGAEDAAATPDGEIGMAYRDSHSATPGYARIICDARARDPPSAILGPAAGTRRDARRVSRIVDRVASDLLARW